VGLIHIDLFTTLDGVAQAPGAPDEDKEGGFAFGGWQAPLFDDVVGEHVGTGLAGMDALLLGRKTYEASLRMGAKLEPPTRYIVFSRHAPPADAPLGVEFVNEAIGPYVRRLREQPGKDIWLMGGGDLIASFLDEGAIDELVITVAPVFIGDGIPLIARRHRHVPLELRSVEQFENGVVQLHYRVQNHP